MSSNVRPESMERITTPALANAFISRQIEDIRAQVAAKRFFWLCPAVWTPALWQRC